MTTYQQRKAKARVICHEVAEFFRGDTMYLSEIIEVREYLYRIGKYYGLVREFRENGLI